MAQLDQHLASKVHRKKALEAAKKAKKEAPTAKGKRSLKGNTATATSATSTTTMEEPTGKSTDAGGSGAEPASHTAGLSGTGDFKEGASGGGRGDALASEARSKPAVTQAKKRSDSSGSDSSGDAASGSDSDSSVDITKLTARCDQSLNMESSAVVVSDESGADSDSDSEYNGSEGGSTEQGRQENVVPKTVDPAVAALAAPQEFTAATTLPQAMPSVFTNCEVITPSGGDLESSSSVGVDGRYHTNNIYLSEAHVDYVFFFLLVLSTFGYRIWYQ